MKVAFVTAFPRDPATPQGGVEAVSVSLTRALRALDDLELHVVTTDAECGELQTQRWEGMTIHRLPRHGRRVLHEAVGPGRRLVSRHVENLNPDVIHAHDVYGLMVKGLAIPRVFTIHGFIHADTQVSGTRLAWLRAQLWSWVETRGWADQPHIISISPYVRERLNGTARGVIHDIDNPIAQDFFDDFPRQPRRGRILCAAVICPRKNQLALLEAFAQLVAAGHDVELRFAGRITAPAYGDRLRARTADLALDDRVHVLGALDTAAMRAELATAHVFALTSLEEGAPMGIEEAMAAGVPVVASNRCGMPYMVRDGESGFLVNPLEPEDIAWRLEQVLTSDERAARMGTVAQGIARDRFHPDAVARRTREVYRRALRDRRGGRLYA